MALTLKNLDIHFKDNPRLGETLKQMQDYINQNVTVTAGNKLAQPPVINAPSNAQPVAQAPQPPTSGVAVPDKNKVEPPPRSAGGRSTF